MTAEPRPGYARRLAGIALVLVLHAAIVAVFWHISIPIGSTASQPVGEIVWILPPPEPQKPKPSDRQVPLRTAPTAGAIADYHGITVPEPPPNLGGLNRSLFGCADMDKLSPEERTRCAGAQFALRPDDSVDFHDHVDRSRLAALWERGRLRQNGPMLLPCMNPHAPPGISLAIVACLAKGAVEGGFDPNTQPSYADTPEIVHLPNNGDPPDHPTGF